MQADLFQVHSAATSMNTEVKESFLDKFRISLRVDQALVILISLVVVYVVVFSFGFEKGKRSAMREFHRQEVRKAQSLLSQSPKAETVVIDATKLPAGGSPAVSAQVIPVISEGKSASAGSQVEAKLSSEDLLKSMKGKYTIQLVTFKTKAEADKLIEKLSQKGFRGFLVPQGKFFLVCVNDFESRPMANAVLKDLLGKGLAPKDAYIRNMPKVA